MEQRWSLDELYASFEAEEFKRDFESCTKYIERINLWASESLNDTLQPVGKAESYISMCNEFLHLYTRLYYYGELSLSVEAKNQKALQVVEKLQGLRSGLVETEARFCKWLGSIGDLDSIINSSELLKEHSFQLKEMAEKSRYLLDEKNEAVISTMRNTGSGAWSKLHGMLTSTLMVDINIDGEDKKLPLSMVRSMAFEGSAEKRKTAYEAELKAYEKIDESAAACLNAIKGEVITLTKMRGFKSPLHETLFNSRLDFETLDAMIAAMKESLPAFRKYFRKKAELLGHKSGLPFHDMFAPMGDVEARFTYEEAAAFIVDKFADFSVRLAQYAKNAFEKRWIDAEPREGKRGGAFCENIHVIKESRILANFTGSFYDVLTIAHELGHGYHGYCLDDETYLNSVYPMPIAETASIFCETIITNAALKNAPKEKAFSILENDLQGAGQVIVDIYSRYLFETELFRRREEGSVSVEELKQMMLEAQKEAYGDGLDHEYLHPYMWVNKSHYYDADFNFYNFPYAFGLLFAKGLYAEYLKRGQSFVEDYDKLLSVTGKNMLADVTAMMGIDIRTPEFWRGSLKLIEEDIEKFISIG